MVKHNGQITQNISEQCGMIYVERTRSAVYTVCGLRYINFLSYMVGEDDILSKSCSLRVWLCVHYTRKARENWITGFVDDIMRHC